MTNGKWLRAQDDETLADFIAEGEAYARVLSVTDGADGTFIVKENREVSLSLIEYRVPMESDEDGTDKR